MKKQLALLALLVAAAGLRADVPAQLLLNGDDTPRQGMLRWLPADKQYVLSIKAGNGVSERRIAASDIRVLKVKEPDAWKQAMDAARKAPDSAIPQLKTIIQQYKMLQWDAEAAAMIAKIYLRKGQAAQAVTSCKEVAQANPRAAWDSAMAPVMWQAMIEAKQTTGLAGMLDKGATSPDRKVAAQATLRRGDLLIQQGETKNALKDGYLRVVFLYGDQSDARAEALYHAAEAFDKLGQATYAEKMRSQLLTGYRDSTWAKKLSSN